MSAEDAARPGDDQTFTMPVPYATLQRLHGDACATCGRTDAPILPAGLMFTTDGKGHWYGWPVRGCARHRQSGVT